MQVTIAIALEPPDQTHVVRLLEASDAYAASLYPAESNHLVDVASLEKSNVSFFVARIDGKIAGCCALVDVGDDIGEIKRMFVDPKARGLRIGKLFMDELEQRGGELGLKAIRLETGINQPEAINLYRSCGFREIGPFQGYKPDPLSIFMEKKFSV